MARGIKTIKVDVSWLESEIGYSQAAMVQFTLLIEEHKARIEALKAVAKHAGYELNQDNIDKAELAAHRSISKVKDEVSK